MDEEIKLRIDEYNKTKCLALQYGITNCIEVYPINISDNYFCTELEYDVDSIMDKTFRTHGKTFRESAEKFRELIRKTGFNKVVQDSDMDEFEILHHEISNSESILTWRDIRVRNIWTSLDKFPDSKYHLYMNFNFRDNDFKSIYGESMNSDIVCGITSKMNIFSFGENPFVVVKNALEVMKSDEFITILLSEQ